ncbi:hypothetical protein [Microvirga rosea]|uniref:hypothetical protein n=1 Tax=Microvirga rosea TaxID=2715425 RepID=UPI001D0B36A1|nr:hypothetical protein [Microvirga rosea]MCB8823295.1 hypothetical protein [Microvirga rosea]
MIGLPFIASIALAIYALVRGSQRLLLPPALIDALYPYALLPWERPLVEGLSFFHQQFVVLALIGSITQAAFGLPAILPFMPEMKTIPMFHATLFVP